ncbi:unnamed protein product [Musa hybrid cultivar]
MNENILFCEPNEILWLKLQKSNSSRNFFTKSSLKFNMLSFTAVERGIELAVVIPVLVLGPLLQPTLNASAMHVIKYLDCSARKYANAVQGYADVLDVAEAHALVYEEAEGAARKRFLCADLVLHREDLVRILAGLFPQYPVPDECSNELESIPANSHTSSRTKG